MMDTIKVTAKRMTRMAMILRDMNFMSHLKVPKDGQASKETVQKSSVKPREGILFSTRNSSFVLFTTFLIQNMAQIV